MASYTQIVAGITSLSTTAFWPFSLPTFQQHQKSAGAATSTRVDADRGGVSGTAGGQLPGNGTQLESDFYADAREKDSGPDHRDTPWSPDAVLMDIFSSMPTAGSG